MNDFNNLSMRAYRNIRFYIDKSIVECRKISALVRKNKYDKIAAELQDLLLLQWDKQTKTAIRNVLRALHGTEQFSAQDLEAMLAELEKLLGTHFSNGVAPSLLEIQTQVYTAGLQEVISVRPSFHIIDKRALAALQRHNVYWVKHYFDKQLRDKTVQFAEQIIRDGLSREQAGKLFADEYAKKFDTESTRYWEGYANHVVTRTRALGAISGMERAGVKYYEISAMIDHNTTDICRKMDGRIIPVSRGIEERDALIGANTPEEVMNIAPWPDADMIAGLQSNKLPSGAILPPYHFNCRTDFFKWTPPPGATSIENVDMPKEGSAAASVSEQIGNRIKHAVANQEQLSKKEISKIIDYAKHSNWGVHKIKGKKTMQYHYEEKARSPYINATNITMYNQKAIDLIRNSSREIYLTLAKDKYPQIIFRMGKNNVIIDISDQRIQSFGTFSSFAKKLKKLRYLKLNNSHGITKWITFLFKNTD